MKDRILLPLESLYQAYRDEKNKIAKDDKCKVSKATKLSQALTINWQNIVGKFEGVLCEESITINAGEKIDVIDIPNNTAYELKVSGKNIEHEFYKDIFKVLTYRQAHPEITKFVFISESTYIKKFEETTLCKKTIELAASLFPKNGFSIELYGF